MVRPRVVIFVEGGNRGSLATECRRGFSSFFERAGLKGKMPQVIACGSRNAAFDDFRVRMASPEPNVLYLLLVDAEAPVSVDDPWQHVRNRVGDHWHRPAGARDEQFHLMVQCMESWLLADIDALKQFYKKDFLDKALPGSSTQKGTPQIETIPKQEVLTILKKATARCAAGVYSKGGHSFKVLAEIDPQRVQAGSPWAKKLIDYLKNPVDE